MAKKKRAERCAGNKKAWNGIKDDFSIFHIGNFLPFHFHCIPKIFHSVLKFSSLFHSILPNQKTFGLEAIQLIFCIFAMLYATICKSARNNTKMQRPVTGMHIAHGLMCSNSQDFDCGGGDRKSHAMT